MRSRGGRRASVDSAPRVPVLLTTQLLFNLGFYAVVPFIAVVLSEDFALGGAAVGVVLGVRTAAQQGMFLLGGVLADRFGARAVILAGCAVRVTGFLTLAGSLWAPQPLLWLFVMGTVLTGLGGALFSPGVNTLVAEAESRRRMAACPTAPRATLFAWLGLTGEVGAVLGPLAGALLLGWGFPVVAASGAVLFIAIAVFLRLSLPSGDAQASTRTARRVDAAGGDAETAGPDSVGRAEEHPRGEAGIDALRGSEPELQAAVLRDGEPRAGESRTAGAGAGRGRSWRSLRDRGFCVFASLHAVDLLAYNQLYLTVPLELRRAGGGVQEIGLMFAGVSLLTLTLQLPVSRWFSRLRTGSALRCGYLASAVGFSLLAANALLAAGGSGGVALGPVFVAVAFLTLGHLIANPAALGAVPGFAGAGPTGSYFGLLATCGGLAVLLGNVAAGQLMGGSGAAADSFPAWLFLAVLPVISALFVPLAMRRGRPG